MHELYEKRNLENYIYDKGLYFPEILLEGYSIVQTDLLRTLIEISNYNKYHPNDKIEADDNGDDLIDNNFFQKIETLLTYLESFQNQQGSSGCNEACIGYCHSNCTYECASNCEHFCDTICGWDVCMSTCYAQCMNSCIIDCIGGCYGRCYGACHSMTKGDPTTDPPFDFYLWDYYDSGAIQ